MFEEVAAKKGAARPLSFSACANERFVNLAPVMPGCPGPHISPQYFSCCANAFSGYVPFLILPARAARCLSQPKRNTAFDQSEALAKKYESQALARCLRHFDSESRARWRSKSRSAAQSAPPTSSTIELRKCARKCLAKYARLASRGRYW